MSEVLVQYWQVPLTTEKCDFRFNIKISAYFGTCTPLREGEQQYQSSRCGWDGIQVPETLWWAAFVFGFFGGGFNAFVVCFQRKVQRFVRLVLLSLFFFFFFWRSTPTGSNSAPPMQRYFHKLWPKKKIIAQNDTFLTHALKKFGMLAKSQASPITHVT